MNMMGNMNMNPIGMNNQLMTNFAMDDTAMKIKAIIDPYEKKISELEKIIKQKDFEILVLKEKLNKYKNNQMNMNMNNNQMMMNNQNGMNNQININNMNMMNPKMMNNNANWMNYYNNNNNMMNLPIPYLNINQNKLNPPLPNMKVTFNYEGEDYYEPCNFDEKTKIVCGRFCKKFGINYKNYNFYFDSKLISRNIVSQWTIAGAGIKNDSKIFVKAKSKDNNFFGEEETDSDGECECESGGMMYNCSFRTTSGQTNMVIINPEHSIETLLRKYLFKIGKYNELAKNNLVFMRNASLLKYNDKTKIKNFFHMDYNPIITVNSTQNTIGG